MAAVEVLTAQSVDVLYDELQELPGLPHGAQSGHPYGLRGEGRYVCIASLAGGQYSSSVLLRLRRAIEEDDRVSAFGQLPQRGYLCSAQAKRGQVDCAARPCLVQLGA